jgi:hypothetical protein
VNIFEIAVASFETWDSHSYKELLRVDIPRSECNYIAILVDDKIIFIGWSNGCIIDFSPQLGKELCVINKAHLNWVP